MARLDQRLSSLSNTQGGPASPAPEPLRRTSRQWIPITVVVLAAVAVFAVVAWAVSGRNVTNQTGTQMSPGVADQHRNTAGPQVLTGTMDDWIGAVCFAGIVADGGTGFFLPGAADGRNCTSALSGRDASVPIPEAVGRFPIFIATYSSPSALAEDLKPRLAGAPALGPYADGVDPASREIVVFALRADETPGGDPLAPLRPLMPYGFALHGASPAPAPTPGSGGNNAMPAPNVVPAPPTACGVNLAAPQVIAAVEQLPPYPGTGWAWSKDPRTFDGNFNPCATLSTALVSVESATGSSPVTALMFHNGTYLGTATSKPYGFTSLNSAQTTDGTVVLTYKTPGACNACAPAAVNNVRYQWQGDHVVMLDPPPPSQ